MLSESQRKASRKWNDNNLERLYVTVKKGQKDIIKQVAESKGESLNGYIVKAIQKRIDEDLQD